MFVEDGLQRVSEHFSFAGFGFVRQDVNFDVRIRASSQIHGLQTICFFDPHYELEGKHRAVGWHMVRCQIHLRPKQVLTLPKKFPRNTLLTLLYRRNQNLKTVAIGGLKNLKIYILKRKSLKITVVLANMQHILLINITKQNTFGRYTVNNHGHYYVLIFSPFVLMLK